MNCCECSSPFTKESRIPMMLPNCGHSLCRQCLEIKKSIPLFKCPQCMIEYSPSNIGKFPVNMSLLCMIEFFSQANLQLENSNENQISKHSISNSKTIIIFN